MVNTGLLVQPWYPREDDMIGGWCVMPIDEPPSQGTPAVASFIDQKTAEHIAELHNNWLKGHTGADSTIR